VALGVVSGATLFELAHSFPGGADRFEAQGLWVVARSQLVSNWLTFATLPFAYPPLLVFTLPVILAAYGWTLADRFSRAACVFALGLFVPLVLYSNLVEVRAQMMILVLLLPASMLGVTRLFSVVGPSEVRRTSSSVPDSPINA
jgi:hypothetical protein